MADFVLLFDDQHLKTYSIQEPVITIGRLPENTIAIVNMGVSRRHARIEREATGNYTITDLNSLNGTLVNNTRVTKGPLSVGDKILIGKYTIVFKDDGNASPDIPAEKNPEETEQVSDFVLEPTIRSAAGAHERGPAGGEAGPGAFPQAPRSPTPAVTGLPEESAQPDEPVRGDEKAINCPVLIETTKHVVYRLDKENFTLGNSEDDDIFVDGLFIEEAIVEIEKKDDGYWLINKKLLGKTKVNGSKVKNHLLMHKDRIEIGSSTFRYMENE
ncbi:MAG: FHA domain-containing protein [Chitinivibrionales bacterium]|nr:FHA domain-containing protein [Chitinivibrionales bacterium]